MNFARAYLRTQAETASKERLMVLLLEAALKHTRSGAAELEARRPVAARTSLLKASDIVAELLATLDVSQAPSLQSVKDIYGFVWQRLAKAMATDDAKYVREAERAFAPIVEAFASAVAQLTGGAQSAQGAP